MRFSQICTPGERKLMGTKGENNINVTYSYV